MKNRIFACLLLLLNISLPALAGWEPLVRNFTPRDYAAGTQNWRVMQSSQGWMYMANNYGLLEFDGSSWHIYGIWNSSAVRAVAEGRDGVIYVGGTNDFGVFTGSADGGRVYRSLADSVPAACKNFGEVWNISYDDGTIYVQTRNYLFVCGENGRVEVIDPASIIYASLVVDHCLYVATSSGLYVYSAKRLHSLRGSSLLSGKIVSAMAPYTDHSFFVATDFSGLYVFDGEQLQPFYTEVDAFLRKNQLYSLAVGADYMAFGTVLKGLAVTDKKGAHPVYVGREQGLTNSTVLSVAFDRDDNLWLGLDQGAALVPLRSPLRFLREPGVSYGSGYTYAERGEYKYYGTNQGLYFRRGGGGMQVVEGSLGQVWKLREVQGTLFCCHNRGLFVLAGESLTQVPMADGVWDVLSLAEGKLLACTYSGFVLLGKRGAEWQAVAHLRGCDETTLYATLDRWGRVWMPASAGVTCFTLSADGSSVTPNVLLPEQNRGHYTVCQLDGEVYVTGEGYFAKATKEGDLEEEERLPEQLAGKHPYNIISRDREGNLIFVYDGRICVRRFVESSGEYESFVHEVMNDPTFYIGGFANLNFRQDGRAVLGGVEGFYLFDDARIRSSLSTNNIYIRRVRNAEMGIVYGESDLQEEREAIRLPFGRYVFRVEYSGDLVNRQGMMFRSRLLPVEKEFGEWSTQPYRDINLLSDGHYTLEVVMHATDAEESFASVSFVVARPWYRRWWAWIIYLVLALIVGGSVYYVFQRRIARDKQRIQDEKLKELHLQEIRILQLEHEKAQFDLKSKSRELNSALLNQVNRNEMTSWIQRDVRRVMEHLAHGQVELATKSLRQLDGKLSGGHQDKDWKRFEENFDFVNDQFIRKLTDRFPWMSQQEKKLCVYIHMGLQTKEIAPLLNVTTRGVEMMRYRMRQKMQLEEQANLKVFFDELAKQ